MNKRVLFMWDALICVLLVGNLIPVKAQELQQAMR